MYLLSAFAAGLVRCFYIDRLGKLSEGIGCQLREGAVFLYPLNKLPDILCLLLLLMDSLLQTLDLSLEVFLFLGVVFAHHGEASIIQLSGDIVLINADEQTVLLNLQNSKHSRCKLHSAIFAKSSLLANSINGVSKQCTAVPTRAKTCWGAGRQWRPQNALHFEALDRADRREQRPLAHDFACKVYSEQDGTNGRCWKWQQKRPRSTHEGRYHCH